MMLFETGFYVESSVAVRVLMAAAAGGLIGWIIDRLLAPKSDG